MFDRMKKVVCAALLTAFAVALAGCGAGGDAPEADGKKMNISVFAWNIEGMGTDPEAPVYQALSEKFHVDFTPITATQSQWKEKLNLLFSSNDLPDLFMSPGFETVQFEKWAQEGFLLPMSDYAGQYKNISAVLQQYDNLTKNMFDGKQYGLPVKNGEGNEEGTICNHTLWIRKDWLNALGLQAPTTTEELYAVAKAFATQDPDGNGVQDTYGYSSNGTWWLYPVMNMFDASYYNFAMKDGKYQPECLSDNMKAAVAYLHTMFQEGILDPDFVVNTEDQIFEKFITGKVGMFYNGVGKTYNKIYDKFKSAYPDKDPKDMFTFCEVIEGPGGVRRIDGKDAYYCITCINNSISEKKRDKILEILEYLLSEEGRTLTHYGIENEHYKKENGEIVNILPANADGTQQQIIDIDSTAQMRILVDWTAPADSDVPNREEYLASMESPRTYAKTDPLRYLKLDESVFSTADKKTLGDMTLQAVTNMIMSKNNTIDSEFEKYKTNWLSTKGELYISEINRLADVK